MKRQAGLGSVFPMESTDAGERLCSSRRVADRRPIPSQVPFRGMPLTRDHSKRMVIGSPSEKPDDDAGFLTDSSNAILLKELKSIIQEHSTHRPFFTPCAWQGTEGLVLQITTTLVPTVDFANEPIGITTITTILTMITIATTTVLIVHTRTRTRTPTGHL